MDADALGLGDCVIPQTATGYILLGLPFFQKNQIHDFFFPLLILAPDYITGAGTTSSTQGAIRLDHPCNLVSDCGILRNCHNSPHIRLPPVNTQTLVVSIKSILMTFSYPLIFLLSNEH